MASSCPKTEKIGVKFDSVLCFSQLPNSNTKDFFSSLNSLKSVHLFPIALFQPCPAASYIDHSNPFYYISVHIIFLKCKSEHVIPLCKDLKGHLYPIWTWVFYILCFPELFSPCPPFNGCELCTDDIQIPFLNHHWKTPAHS